MDTIIYLYKKHGLAKPVIDSHQMEDYLLVKVGMSVGENQWFTHGISPSLAVTAVQALTGGQNVSKADETMSMRFPLGLLFQRFREYRERRDRVRAMRQRRDFFEEEHALIREEMESFLSELDCFVDQRYECHCVYGEAVRKALMFPEDHTKEVSVVLSREEERNEEDVIPSYWLQQLWRQYWQIPEFDGYLQPQWVKLLLENAKLDRFVILGLADCTSAVILYYARRMKSLRWILCEEDVTEELQDFVEEFYQEYGLAVTLQPLEGGKAFARLLLMSRDPICVLDFTEEPHISVGGIAPGSIWIDFRSVEAKARRVLEREKGIAYFSLKEIWKRADKP